MREMNKRFTLKYECQPESEYQMSLVYHLQKKWCVINVTTKDYAVANLIESQSLPCNTVMDYQQSIGVVVGVTGVGIGVPGSPYQQVTYFIFKTLISHIYIYSWL